MAEARSMHNIPIFVYHWQDRIDGDLQQLVGKMVKHYLEWHWHTMA